MFAKFNVHYVDLEIFFQDLFRFIRLLHAVYGPRPASACPMAQRKHSPPLHIFTKGYIVYIGCIYSWCAYVSHSWFLALVWCLFALVLAKTTYSGGE